MRKDTGSRVAMFNAESINSPISGPLKDFRETGNRSWEWPSIMQSSSWTRFLATVIVTAVEWTGLVFNYGNYDGVPSRAVAQRSPASQWAAKWEPGRER